MAWGQVQGSLQIEEQKWRDVYIGGRDAERVKYGARNTTPLVKSYLIMVYVSQFLIAHSSDKLFWVRLSFGCHVKNQIHALR